MLRPLLKPRWIVLLLVTLSISGTCVRLGIWQMHRLRDRRAYNAAVRTGMSQSPISLSDLMPAGAATDATALRYRPVVASGLYDTAHEVVLYGRALEGRPGNHLLTPLVLPDGRAVIVDRGWVPYEMSPPVTAAAPPSGTVEVTGLLEPADPAGTSGPASGPVLTLTTVDVPRLARQLPYSVLPMYIWLRSQSPAQPAQLPFAVPLPELTEGPHQSYMFQWFAFATIFLGGFFLLAWREIKGPGTGGPVPENDGHAAATQV